MQKKKLISTNNSTAKIFFKAGKYFHFYLTKKIYQSSIFLKNPSLEGKETKLASSYPSYFNHFPYTSGNKDGNMEKEQKNINKISRKNLFYFFKCTILRATMENELHIHLPVTMKRKAPGSRRRMKRKYKIPFKQIKKKKIGLVCKKNYLKIVPAIPCRAIMTAISRQ